MWVRFPPGPRALPPLQARRRARSARRWWAVSLLLHAMLVAVLLVGRAPPPPNFLAPPAEIALVFQPSATPPSPRAPEVKKEQPEVATPRPSPAPQPKPPAAPTETPQPPAPAAPAAPEAPPSVRITPPPAEPPPLDLAPEAEQPLPQLRAPPAPKPAPPAPPAASRASPGSRAAQGGFPKPMFHNFFIPPSGNHGDPTYQAFLAANLQAPERGRPMASPFDARGAEQLGSDWFGRFTDWVEAHKFYPNAAAEAGEQGEVTVEFTVQRDGQVTGLELVGRSGSQILDLALQSMFRGKRLPQFPQGAAQGSIVIDLTMHYILL